MAAAGREAFLTLSFRLLVDVESLNMAESVGNVTKHRKAPVVVEMNGSYRLVYVPVISGMTLSHHYQRVLARVASEAGLSVTRMSLMGYFPKFSDDDVIKNYYKEVTGQVKKNDLCGSEKAIVEKCVVADVGGFLYTNGPVKRESRFKFSYLIPAMDSIKSGAVGVVPQIHVRYTPEAREREQALIYVENGSAVYTGSFELDASRIARLEVCEALGKTPTDLGVKERLARFDAAVKALAYMLGNAAFGAKRSRSLPIVRVESLVAVASRSFTPFMPSPGHDRGYLRETLERAEALKRLDPGFEYEVHYYAREELEAGGEARRHATVEEAIQAAAAKVRKWLEQEAGK